jgi:hypothetical protein
MQTIVVQRDGRLFATELTGAKDAIEMAKKEGILPSDVSLNFIEIPKSSPAPVRIFDKYTQHGRPDTVDNPQIGSYFIPTNKDGYVCTTGKEFYHPGTANALHVKYIEGKMQFEHILEDVYALTCLSLTRPEDCSRDPFTLKLADIRLREHAGGYDEDALEYEGETEMKRTMKMSDTGLYGSVYEHLRIYADRLDQSLIGLRNPDSNISKHARIEIARLLREVTDNKSTNPTTRFVSIILKQDLPSIAGKGLPLCESLAQILEQRSPNSTELDQLEKIASSLIKNVPVLLLG